MTSRDTADVKDSGLYVCERSKWRATIQLKNNSCAGTSFWVRRKSNFLLLLVDRLGLDPAGHKNFETNE